MFIVLMSTFNGAAYLIAQIESIIHQIDIDLKLVIRDDGSKDNTLALANELAQKNPNIEVIAGENKGFVGSFSELIKYAWDNFPEYEYFAFADQDDVWYPNKLKVACKKLSEYPKDVPNLFCSNSDIIDGEGKKTGKKFRNYYPHYTRGNILMFPTLQGCSMVFNRKAVELYAGHLPMVSFHDRWMYLICHFLGNVYYAHTPLFGYRVHENNTLGLKQEYGFIEGLRRLLDMLFKKQESEYFRMNKEFFETFSSFLQNDDLIIFKRYLSYKSHCEDKLNLLFSHDFGTPIPTIREKIIYYPHVLLNKL